MIYLDSNIFIYPILGQDIKSEKCLEIINKIVKGEIEAGTSLLTWDEFLHILKKEIGEEKALEESETFLSMPNLTFFKVDKETITKAQTLAQKYNLKPRDAIHASTAIIHNIIEFATYDQDFDKVKELKRIKLN